MPRRRAALDPDFRRDDVGSFDPKQLPFRAYALLILLCLAFFLNGIVALPPTDRDESLFAQATKQMIETGDYVDIHYLGTPRYKKPIGIYWLQSFSVRLLNPQHRDEIWAYRVPSLIGATVAVLMTAAIGALLFNGAVGFTAAVMLATCLDLTVEAHLAKTDAVLLATVMVAMFGLVRAYIGNYSPPLAGGIKGGLVNSSTPVDQPPPPPPASGVGTTLNAFLFWTAIGLGILVKGPVILLPVVATLLWLRFTDKNLTWFARLKPWIGIPYTFALIAPWFIAINLASHGQFTQQAGGHDFLAKLWQGQERGFMPPGFYLATFPVMFFPFSLFALLAIPDAWHQRRDQAVRFCLGWIVPTWIMFEISSTKLPHYILPAYPAIALLTAKAFLDGFPILAASAKRWWMMTAVSLWMIVGMVFAVGFAALPFIVDHRIDVLQIVTSGLFLIAQSAGLLFFLQRRKQASLMVLTLGMMLFSGMAIGHTLPNLQRLWVSREIMQQAKNLAPCPIFKIVSAGYEEPSLAFLAGSETKFTPNGVYAAAEMQSDRCRVGIVSRRLLKQFLTASADFPLQPYPVGTVVEGINIGHGSGTELSFYLMPQTKLPEAVYP